MDILLTFTGFHDPFSKSLIGQEEEKGPILSLVTAKSFGKVILFSTPRTAVITKDTGKAIGDIDKNTAVQIIDLELNDPTDYFDILHALRKHLKRIQEENNGASFFISTASGTPQMHACWLILASSGEIPARILHIRPAHFVTKENPLLTEIDLSSPEFPIIRFQVGKKVCTEGNLDLSTVISEFGIVAEHPKIQKVIETASLLAPSDAPILIQGETGTGKEVIAHLIHRLSSRAKESFVAVNCAAIPENLVESILFGHKKGSFTGAFSDQLGKFDIADKGTLFLDELGELPVAIQAKLLRVLQDGLVETVGDRKPHKVDVRIITATNKDLKKLIQHGKFREDLYYRINVGEIKIPPLRERKTDIPKLALHILDRVNSSIKKPKRLSQKALSRLQQHSWPGNVRDLENAIERSVRLCKSDVLDADDLLISEAISDKDPFEHLPEPHQGFSMEEYIGGTRKQLILRALEISAGSQSKAARLLGLTPQAIHKFLKTGDNVLNRSRITST